MKPWPAKDPDDIKDYGLNWSKQMTLDADTIASYDPFIESGSVAIVDEPGKIPSHTDTHTSVWLSGGELGEECVIVNRITTTGGRQYDHSRKLKIKAK